MPANILSVLGIETKEYDGFKSITLDYRDIVITKHNKYSMGEIEELATGIELAGELQEPLILGKVNGEYWLVSGHRRISATDILVKAGKEEYAQVQCRYKTMSETEFRLHLLIGNIFNRKMTDHDMMMQAAEWKEVLNKAKEEKLLVLDKGERIRDYVAEILGVSTGKVGTLEAINNNATDTVKEQMAAGTITTTTAYDMSSLPKEQQEEIVQEVEANKEAGNDLKAEEIQRMVAEKKEAERQMETEEKEEKESHSIAEQKKESVSDTDTTEDEKENAKKLHVLKMLEKYYIYMNEDDVRVLDAILEDCKRRKREYGLEDCGQTAE